MKAPNKLIWPHGDPPLTAEIVQRLRHQGGQWAVFQNHDLGHPMLGHLVFLQYGPENTYKTPPLRAPDGQYGLGWRYLLVGFVNYEAGTVEEEEWNGSPARKS